MKPALLPIMMLVAVGLLAGCSSKSSKVGYCPGVAALVDASSQPMFRQGTAPDPANILYTMQITGVESSCNYDKKGHEADVSVDVHFRATRAPSGEPARYTVPYFLAVTQADRMVNKQPFSVTVEFAPGSSVADATDSVSTHITTDEGKKPYDYQVLAGLPLSKEQLDYNRTIGRYGQ